MKPLIGIRPTVTLQWQRYLPYNLLNVQRFAPSLAGVYKLAVDLQNGKKRVIYVGQAVDLEARLRDHLSEWETNVDLASMIGQYRCSFALALLPHQADRDAAERALYLHFRPACNDQEPSGPACHVSPLTSP
jgi:excinuclease UvrABC nuclease subunit